MQPAARIIYPIVTSQNAETGITDSTPTPERMPRTAIMTEIINTGVVGALNDMISPSNAKDKNCPESV